MGDTALFDQDSYAVVLGNILLQKGAHGSREEGVCVMEAAAWIAGEMHSDHPQCVSPVLGAFLRKWNDSVNDEFRQKLKPFIPRILNTANDGKDEARAWMATDWLVRVCAPAWLDLAKLTQHAMALRTAEQICDTASAERLQRLIDDERGDSHKAWDAVSAAASAAAWDAVSAAASAAAWDAAWDALQPTVELLQQSALELLERMLDPEAAQ